MKRSCCQIGGRDASRTVDMTSRGKVLIVWGIPVVRMSTRMASREWEMIGVQHSKWWSVNLFKFLVQSGSHRVRFGYGTTATVNAPHFASRTFNGLERNVCYVVGWMAEND